MNKKRVNITIDPELYSQARKLGLNISGVTERALQTYILSLNDKKEQITAPRSPELSSNRASKGETSNEERSKDTPSYADMSVDQIITKYEKYGKTVLNRSQSTLDQHTRYIGRLLRHAEKPTSAIEEADIIEYIKTE